MTTAQPRTCVAFRRRGLVGPAVVGVILLAAGLGLFVDEYVLLGLTVPTPLRLLVALASTLLGGWLTYGIVERALSDDPAIEVTPAEVRLHVAPGAGCGSGTTRCSA